MTRHVTLAGVLLAAGIVSQASADTVRFRLADHPDGNAAPPPYGLRMDNLFGSGTGVTSFSFSATGASVFLDYDTEANSIRIYGTLMGGRDLNASSVAHAYDLDFTYSLGVSGNQATGWRTDGSGADSVQGQNGGSLTAMEATSLHAAGASWNLSDKSNGTNTFVFAPDSDRLAGHGYPANTWVGRGWLMAPGVSGGSQDFLFTATVVPLPAGALAGIGGLAGVGLIGVVRRRRAATN